MKRCFVATSGGDVDVTNVADMEPKSQSAAAEPNTIPMARCDCGDHGCGGTDVTITRRGDEVHWNWSGMTPIDRSVVFDAAEYDREVARIASFLAQTGRS